ncbi:MAG TPA: hypothetical protein PK156_11590 [Polyangium sp.]|nr:hypothetical protein [Polyangium sp.]
MSQPSGPSDSGPPSSTKRSNDLFAACGPLSSDGAAAVLAYARTLIDKNRRWPAVLQHVDLWKFVGFVDHAATEIKEIVLVKERRFRREFVYISAVYRHLQARGDAANMSLAAFKARLLEAYTDKKILLERCRNTDGVSPLVLEASLIHGPRGPLHLVERDKIADVKDALNHVTSLLPDAARPIVASFARRVHADEALREGRPRLITLDPDKFAARILEFVNRHYEDISIRTLYWKLEERGEMTGIGFESFKNRIFAAQKSGRLQLREGSESPRTDTFFMSVTTLQDDREAHFVIRRTTVCPPIPWGPPSPPIIRRLVLHAR